MMSISYVLTEQSRCYSQNLSYYKGKEEKATLAGFKIPSTKWIKLD